MKRSTDERVVRATTCEPADLEAVKGGWEDGGWGDWGGDWGGGDWGGGTGLPDFGGSFPGWYDDGQSCVIPQDYLCC